MTPAERLDREKERYYMSQRFIAGSRRRQSRTIFTLVTLFLLALPIYMIARTLILWYFHV
jgi:hypothetical protein